ncbi:MAG: glycerophosphodiester phosphodiesterase family protein [Melioribacteraceae bacterium]|nr:glycerophosphodiester phosphodiesterase family protein [Melioribacteraceae bacterium]
MILQNLPLIIAHRGESYDAPENTLASINLAWQRDADAVEIDVRLSKDNKVVVFHDKTTRRLGGRNEYVKKQSLTELKQLDVGSWKSEKYNNERIPTLTEVLATVPKKKKLIIEIKSSIKIIPFLKHDIENSGLEKSQIEIISFKYEVLKELKVLLPIIKMLYLADLDYSWMTKVFSPKVEKLIEMVEIAKLDGLNAWAGKLLTEKFICTVKWKKLLLYVWTVNDLDQAKKLADFGVDGITTDRAELMKKHLYLNSN